MLNDEPIKVRRIDVSFAVDIDMTELNKVKKELDLVRPASVEAAVVFDKIKARHTYYLARLEGECQAYMNIAKASLKELHGL